MLLVAALSGYCALGAEVVWTRVLALLLGATVYTFSIVLAVFLIGLGVGSAVGSALTRRFPQHALSLCQAFLVPAVLWGALALTRSLPYWPIAPSLALSPWISFQLDLDRAMWAIFPAAVLWGASFPLCLAAAAAPEGDPARLVGRVYAANTIGSIIGALLFSLVLVPLLGTGRSQQVLAVVASMAAIALPIADLVQLRSRAVTGWLLAAGAASVVISFAVVVPSIPAGLVAYGRSMAYRLGAWNPRTNTRFSPDLLYVGEGINESVAVSEEGGVRLFHVSGKTEASTNLRDMRLQRMLGHLPALIHPEPRSVLIVGFGAGVTSGTFVLYPSIQRIVICELEPLIPQRVAPYFQAENYGVVSDPRVRIVYDDARHFLLTTKEKFDIITSDPIHPWVKGSAALYSRDYFQLVRRHLNPGGAVSQWVPLYQASEGTIKSEIATFFSAFPEGSVWANNERGQGYDLVLVGTSGPTLIDLDATAARLQQPSYARVVSSLEAVGIPSLADLLSTYVTRQQDLGPWLVGAKINRDWKPWLQYQAGLESYTEQEADIYSVMAQYRVFPKDLFRGSPQLQQAIMNAGDTSARQ